MHTCDLVRCIFLFLFLSSICSKKQSVLLENGKKKIRNQNRLLSGVFVCLVPSDDNGVEALLFRVRNVETVQGLVQGPMPFLHPNTLPSPFPTWSSTDYLNDNTSDLSGL